MPRNVTITVSDMIESAEELVQNCRVNFPVMVATGQITHEQAEKRTLCLMAIVQVLKSNLVAGMVKNGRGPATIIEIT